MWGTPLCSYFSTDSTDQQPEQIEADPSLLRGELEAYLEEKEAREKDSDSHPHDDEPKEDTSDPQPDPDKSQERLSVQTTESTLVLPEFPSPLYVIPAYCKTTINNGSLKA